MNTIARLETNRDNVTPDDYETMLEHALRADGFAYLNDPFALASQRGVVSATR